MGLVYADITLANSTDAVMAERGLINKKDVRQTTARALVDTGAGTLVISEAVCQKLGLEIRGLRKASFANEDKKVCKVTEPVEIHWNNRETACPALVVPGAETVLLGAIPLEDMDLVVNPAEQTLEGAHGDEVVCMVKRFGE
jgi:clan AA aspartic protease